MIDFLENLLSNFIQNELALNLIMTIIVIVIAYVSYIVVVKIILTSAKKIVKKPTNIWDNNLLKTGIFRKASLLFPLIILTQIFKIWNTHQNWIYSVFYIIAMLIGLKVISSFLKAIELIYTSKGNKKFAFPFRIFSQTLMLFLYLIVIVISISLFMDVSPLKFVTGLSAMAAVVLLIFKDTILSIISTLEISSYDLVRVGDWIEMPELDLNGEVIETNLHSIKVQNWDHTISTIPTMKLTDTSFKNWRNMFEKGSRRIKRSLYIDMNTIKLCSPEMIEKYKKINLVYDYICRKEFQISEFHKAQNINNKQERTNLLNMSNIGVFREYIKQYLKHNISVNQNETFLVRQLAPTEHGLPIEIYFFLNDTRFIHYEATQSDIFDYLLAIVPEFDLKLFQNPSGNDFRKLK